MCTATRTSLYSPVGLSVFFCVFSLGLCFVCCVGDFVPQSEIFPYIFSRPHSNSLVAIELKFCIAKRTHVPVGPAMFDVNRCNESPLWGQKNNWFLGVWVNLIPAVFASRHPAGKEKLFFTEACPRVRTLLVIAQLVLQSVSNVVSYACTAVSWQVWQ